MQLIKANFFSLFLFGVGIEWVLGKELSKVTFATLYVFWFVVLSLLDFRRSFLYRKKLAIPKSLVTAGVTSTLVFLSFCLLCWFPSHFLHCFSITTKLVLIIQKCA